MISVKPYSTMRITADGIRYNLRTDEDIYRIVHYCLAGNTNEHPLYSNARVFRCSSKDPVRISEEIIWLQTLYNKLSGIRIRVLILDVPKNDLDRLYGHIQIVNMADRFSGYFFYSGFQCVYGVFDYGDHYTIKYAINPVSFVDGSKFIQNDTYILDEEYRCALTVYCEVIETTPDSASVFDFDSLEYA